MKARIFAAVLLTTCAVFAQIGNPLAGVWDGPGLRLILKGAGIAVYTGSLEFKGKTYPVTCRADSTGDTLSGNFAADGKRFDFSARVQAGKMKFATSGREFLLTRGPAGNSPDPPPSAPSGETAGLGAVHRHANGLSLTVPAGWNAQDGPQGIILLPPGVSFNPRQLDELYAAATQPGSVNDPKIADDLRQQFGQQSGSLNRSSVQLGRRQAIVYSGQVRQPGQNLTMGIRIYLVQDGPNVLAVIGLGPADRVDRNDAGLRQAAASISMQAPAAPTELPPAGPLSDGSPLATQWLQKVRGQKLQQLTTGNYDAGRSVWILAADGAFTYSSNYSGAVYASGGSSASVGRIANGKGRWRIVSRDGVAILQLKFSSGEQQEFRLTLNGSQTFLNGRRTYVTPPNEGN